MNGTLSDTQRDYLQAENAELRNEITRISDGATFNGISLLDGTLDLNIQAGIENNASSQINVALAQDMDSTGLALAATIGGDGSTAGAALDEINTAIETVSTARSDFGARQNRLESSIRNINNQSENLSAANSRIRDVDVANETSSMTSFQILQQAGVSVLSQANQIPGLAMSLLG